MVTRHPEAADRITLEVEFDQHRRLLAHDPAVMARFDRHDLRSLVFHDTTVGVFDVDFAPGKEADVGVHAQVSPDNRFHVDRPAKSNGVHHALDARPASTSNVEPDAADVAMLGAFDGCDERVQRLRSAPNGLASCRDSGFPGVLPRGLPRGRPRGLLFRHVPSRRQPERLMLARQTTVPFFVSSGPWALGWDSLEESVMDRKTAAWLNACGIVAPLLWTSRRLLDDPARADETPVVGVGLAPAR